MFNSASSLKFNSFKKGWFMIWPNLMILFKDGIFRVGGTYANMRYYLRSILGAQVRCVNLEVNHSSWFETRIELIIRSALELLAETAFTLPEPKSPGQPEPTVRRPAIRNLGPARRILICCVRAIIAISKSRPS